MPSDSFPSRERRHRKRRLTCFLLRERLKRGAVKARQQWLETYPTIFVSLFLILSVWLLFGVGYIIIPPVLILIFRQRHTQEFSLRVLLRTYVILLLVCLAAFLATQGFWLCVLLNLAVPFLVVGLLSDKFNPKSYFVYGMEFVFFQMTPVSLPQLGMQLVVLLYARRQAWRGRAPPIFFSFSFFFSHCQVLFHGAKAIRYDLVGQKVA